LRKAKLSLKLRESSTGTPVECSFVKVFQNGVSDMRKKTLRVLSRVMCLILLASVILQAPLMAVETIPVRVGNQTFNVTPGQWVTVRNGPNVTHYNVRFVNGRPVALEMAQYTKIVFGEGAAAGSVADDVASANSPSGNTSASNSNSPSSNNTRPNTGTTNNAGNVADDLAQSGANPMGGGVADDISQSTSVADDLVQTGNTGNVADDLVQTGNAGSVADDLVQTGNAGNVADDLVQTGNTANVADDLAQAPSTRTWDPSRHPRDPQTGRFISHEEAIKRGLMDPPAGSTADDVAQAGNAGQVADDVAQAGNAGQVADDVAQAGNAGQVADDVAQAGNAGQVADDVANNGKPGFGEQVKGKFQSGYYTGKGMVNQGFQNVKDSLKSGFSAKNLLITAGITVGVDLATQIMRGEKPSAKKALKTICSAEFVGGVGGAVVGAAAGSFFVPFLTAIPVVGGALSALAPAFGSIVGSSMGAYMAGDLKNGRFSIKEAFKRIDWVGVTGQAIGSTVGAALGSALGPIGTIAGGMIGGYLGNWAAQKIAGLFGKGQSAQLPEMAMPTGTGNPLGGYQGGEVSIGGDELVINDAAAPIVTGGDDILVIGGDEAVIGDYESEVALAYSKYQELYKLYNEMLRQGRQEDAISVAEAMNKAKKEYDDLRLKAAVNK
jgi:hypothetical protein